MTIWIENWNEFGLVAIAGGLGALIGLEREVAEKPAGLRTHILVAAGSTLFALLGGAAIDQFQAHQSRDIIRTDPVRVIQAIVVGISFLGAGTIIHERGQRVEGLTTAASILLTAGIGIAVAVNRLALAASVTVAMVLILFLVGRVERRLTARKQLDNSA